MLKLRGSGWTEGIASGIVITLETKFERHRLHHKEVEDVSGELSRFKTSLDKTKGNIIKTKTRLLPRIPPEDYFQIIDSYLLMLEDPFFIAQVHELIKKERINYEYAVWKVISKFKKSIASANHEYLKDKTQDLENILSLLTTDEKLDFSSLKEDAILIAHNLAPTETLNLLNTKVKGFATDIGNQTSHTVIIAKALDLPGVVGLNNATYFAKDAKEAIIDANQGILIIDPDEKTKQLYEHKRQEYNDYKTRFIYLRDLPAKTLDGHEIELLTNIELPHEIKLAKENGARGVGLYRTEFLYINRDDPPDEEEQFQVYKEVVEYTSPYSVCIRTLDIGGDKFISNIHLPVEMNPLLGLRAIRLCLKHTQIFKTQLKAILRASQFGKVKIMFPMISDIEELILAKGILAEVKEELKENNIGFCDDVEVGIMVETPSAVLLADDLAKEVDFFSLGTNDLIQYILVVDRVNQELSYLYDPLHPAVLIAIKKVVDVAKRNNISISICGEMAADPLFTPLLLGLGLNVLSMNYTSLPKVKEVIRAITLKEAEQLAEEVLRLRNTKQIKKLLQEKMPISPRKI